MESDFRIIENTRKLFHVLKSDIDRSLCEKFLLHEKGGRETFPLPSLPLCLQQETFCHRIVFGVTQKKLSFLLKTVAGIVPVPLRGPGGVSLKFKKKKNEKQYETDKGERKKEKMAYRTQENF